MSQILSLFAQHLQYGEWSGNQTLQDAFCKGLEKAGLKRAGVQYDPHSGGPRTYIAQLQCLGLVFKRNDGSVWLTKAGDDLVGGEPPLPIMQAMLLRHQYPSTYSQLQNLKINPDLKIKPFLFVLQLLNDARVNHLTTHEMIIPMIFGHMHDCLELCIQKILECRSGESLVNVIGNLEENLYAPRSVKTDVKSRLEDIKNIGNTCKNYLQACCLINVERIDREERISFNGEMMDVYQAALAELNNFISVHNEESFQRAYGSWDSMKDTRHLTGQAVRSVSPEEGIIMSQFYQLCGEQAISSVPDDFVEDMYKNYGLDRAMVRDVVEPYVAHSLDYFESTFLELARGGASKAIEFEKAVCNIFQDKLHFKTKHTGQKKRGGVGGYTDVFAVALDNKHCAIIDTKASPSYSLPASDVYTMKDNYIKNYRELTDGQDMNLEFSLYVAGGFRGDVQSKLSEIYAESGVGCSGITARELLHICMKEPSPDKQEGIRTSFKKTKVLSSKDFEL